MELGGGAEFGDGDDAIPAAALGGDVSFGDECGEDQSLGWCGKQLQSCFEVAAEEGYDLCGSTRLSRIGLEARFCTGNSGVETAAVDVSFWPDARDDDGVSHTPMEGTPGRAASAWAQLADTGAAHLRGVRVTQMRAEGLEFRDGAQQAVYSGTDW